ncbi:MAG TPA: hypothetical protein DCQ64_19960 [Candidatus Rokubacteria bacterium]|nr:hypothetical protein [Candidatus Rokubacteria bacterium]
MGRRSVADVTGTLFSAPESVSSIAEQVHRALVEQEEQRCAAREREKGRPMKRRTIRVPIVRMAPTALCQKSDYLLMVREYDYDLADERFCEYCQTRGTLSVAGVNGSPRWMLFRDHQRPKCDYLKDPYFQFGQELAGVKRAYSPVEMESGWDVIRYGRATLQDSWELFRATVENEAPTPSVAPEAPARAGTGSAGPATPCDFVGVGATLKQRRWTPAFLSTHAFMPGAERPITDSERDVSPWETSSMTDTTPSAWPLLFTYSGPIIGQGFLASVRFCGRLLAHAEPEGIWIDGVNPGAFAVGGVDFPAANLELRDTLTKILVDYAFEADSFEGFRAAVERFYHETDADTVAEWDDALAALRAGTLAVPDDLPRRPLTWACAIQVTRQRLEDLQPGDNPVNHVDVETALPEAA